MRRARSFTVAVPPVLDRVARAGALAIALVAGAWIALGGDGVPAAAKDQASLLTFERSIALPGVEGRIDHLALDADGGRLFVAALGNGSVEVVDLRSGTVVHRLEKLAEPQGVAVLPKSGRVAVACGGDGTLRLYDGATFEAAPALALGGDADNVRVEPGTGRLFVGYGDGGIAIVEVGKVAARIPLPGHPEAFALETKGTRLFVNVPPSNEVTVVDRATAKVTAHWAVVAAKANYPMALDEDRRRLFLGCRAPARLLVLDTESGKTVSSVEIVGDVDDVFLDASARRLYVSGGGGEIDVIADDGSDGYRVVERVKTAPGARTSLFAAGERRLYLAVPHRGAQRAEIRVYAVAP